MSLVVYTAVAAGYDVLQPVGHSVAGVDYVCFTEPNIVPPPGWMHRPLPRMDLPPQSQNRYAKFHPHLLFPEYEASVYVDGNIEIVGDLQVLAERALARAQIAFYDHPVRTDPYAEAIECAKVGFDWSGSIRHQVRRYRTEGFAGDAGLFEANVIVRRHNETPVVRAMERWWQEWEHGVKRDQLSLMYVLWKERLRAQGLGRHDARFVHEFFRYRPHRKPIGRSINRVARQVFNRLDLILVGI
ncbi:MAG TPA: glycosyltransferase domain-containing protein [Burkholderiaceae bacterium]|nr:glycosyltransferase domain-containing protein [Burkholderiaceae bacterium]